MPDPFHLLILIVTFLVSVVLGGLIVGGIVAASLALKPFDSQWVSAFGTVLAALGTVSTLGFLVYQNTIQAKELKDERKKREDHEAKQQELLTFQKYEMHKAAFHSTLTQLEDDPHIKFFDREGLYESIFPKNSFEYCAIDDSDSSVICNIEDSYNDIWKHVSKTLQSKNENEYIELVLEYFSKVDVLSRLLRVELLAVHEIGNLYINIENQRFIGNIFNLRSSMFSLEKIIRRLCKFTDQTISLAPGEPLISRYLIPFYKTILYSGNHVHTTDFEEYKPVLSIVIDSYVTLDEASGWSTPALMDAYREISRLINDSPRFIELFKSKDEVVKLVGQLLTGFRQNLGSTTARNPTFVQIESELSHLYQRITS